MEDKKRAMTDDEIFAFALSKVDCYVDAVEADVEAEKQGKNVGVQNLQALTDFSLGLFTGLALFDQTMGDRFYAETRTRIEKCSQDLVNAYKETAAEKE